AARRQPGQPDLAGHRRRAHPLLRLPARVDSLRAELRGEVPALYGSRAGVLQHDAQARAPGGRRHRVRRRFPVGPAPGEPGELQEPRGKSPRVRLRSRGAALRDPVQQARLAERRAGGVPRVSPQPAIPARALLRGRCGGRQGGVRHAQYRVADGSRERLRTRTGGVPMSSRDVTIHEEAAQRIDGILLRFLEESSAVDALLIDRSGQLLARGGTSRSLDTVSLSALAAGAFSSTAAMARLVGEPEFTMLFHQGLKENIHVAAVDDQAILLAVFDHRTTVGMVRLFAKEATAAIGTVLAESKGRPVRTGDLAAPLADGEGARMFKERG